MTTGHGSRAPAPASPATANGTPPRQRGSAIAQKRKKPPATLAPLSTPPRNQRDDGYGSATAARVPLDALFLSRFRLVLRRRITLSGWNPTDADLALLLAGRDGASARVDSLTLDECAHITTEGLRLALPVLQAATTLRLRRCAGLSIDIVAVLPVTLVELDLSYCEWLDDQSVRVLARRCPALRCVSLAHCRRLTDYGVSAFADAPHGSALTQLDMRWLPRVTDTSLLALLLRCPRLERLDAAHLSSMDGLNLQGLPRHSASALATLDLSNNARMHFLTVAHLVRTLSSASLTALDVSHCAQLTDETLVALGRYAPALRILRLAFCTQLTDAGLTRLVVYEPLESEQLADFVADDAARPRCTELTTLELTGCYLVTSDGIRAVARHCEHLEVLLVDGLRRLDARGLDALATHCPRLHTIHWGGILIQSGPGSAAARQAGFFSVPSVDRAAVRALSAIRSLHTLRIGATKCDVDALATLLLGGAVGPQLRELDAAGIATDALCLGVATHCPQLRSLRLSRSRYFSLDAFLTLAGACSQLRLLELESCEQLRDVALSALARHCGATLETLVLSNDWQLTDRGVTHLAQRCPRLRRLAVRHCPEVSPHCLRAIAEHVNPFVVATGDSLEPKPGAVAACLAQDREFDAAARRLGRWWRDTVADRSHTQSAIDRALRHVRRRRRCVVRIQRCVRRWLTHKRQQELVARAQRARAWQCAAHWAWVAAYCRVARLLRRHCRAWRVWRAELAFRRAEEERARRERAAVDIQRVYWGWRGRLRATRRREEVAALHRRRQASAVHWQRVWRGHRGRLRARATAVDCWRRLLKRTKTLEVEMLAATQLTRIGRGLLGRRQARDRAEELARLRQRREKSAIQIQRCARAYLARVLFKRRRARGATAMQRVVRGFLGRIRARCVVLARAYTRAPILLLLSSRSVFTRDLAVAWKRKRDAGELIALACQRVYRGYYDGRLQRRLRLAQRRQVAFVRDFSARKLQHFFRSILIVRRIAELYALLRLRRLSATCIQSVWRMWLGKVRATALTLRRDRRRAHAATLTGLKDPSQDARRRLLHLGAVHVLATTYRQSLLARGWLTPTFVRFLHASATRIQSLVRGVRTRRAVAALRVQLTWAARMVQRVWRGKMGRKQWRVMIERRRRALLRQQEEDRAARVASKRTGEYVLDATAKQHATACVLQQWVRTLQRRQVFQQARQHRDAARRGQATQKLGGVLTLATQSVVFQARVWRECLDRKAELREMEESDVVAMEREVAALKRACLEEFVAHARAAAQFQELSKRKRDASTVKKKLRLSAQHMKETIQPFAEQAKRLTMASARVHVANRQLQDELRVLQRGVAAFHSALQRTLPLEPLLYERDVDALAALLALPPGRESMLDHVEEAEEEEEHE